MSLNSITIPYPDFKLYETIDPEQFDANNAEIVTKINVVIDMLNSIIGGEVADNIRADAISISPISPFTETNVADMLTTFIGRLQSVVDGSSGADFVKVTAIEGLTGSSVQEVLEYFQTILNNLSNTSGETVTGLALHKISADHDGRYYTETEVDAKLALKADTETVNTSLTTKADTTYVDEKLALKTDKSGDFNGTWDGKSITQVLTYNAGSPAYVEVFETAPETPFVGQIWITLNGGA